MARAAVRFHPAAAEEAEAAFRWYGQRSFDGVSEAGSIAVTISTSAAQTSSGKRGSGKLQKIRTDALFLLLAEIKRSVLVFTEADMFSLCQKEAENGRVPPSLEFALAELPTELMVRLAEARKKASVEVSPGGAV